MKQIHCGLFYFSVHYLKALSFLVIFLTGIVKRNSLKIDI